MAPSISAGLSTDTPASESRSTNRRRTLLALALSVLSGALIYVSFPDRGGLYPLLLVAFIPMYVAQYRLMPRRWSAIPVLIATGTYWTVIWFIGWDLLPGFEWTVFVAGVFFALWCAFFAVFDRKFSERTNYRWFIVQMPLWWVALDVLFQNNLYDATNGWLAYRFAGATPFIQTVSVVSTPALTFLVLLFNAGLALVLLAWIDRRWPHLSSVHVSMPVVRWSSVVAGGCAVAWIASSLAIYTSLNSQLSDADTVRVAAIQPSNTNMPVTLFAGGQGPPNAVEEAARKVRQRQQLTELTSQAVEQGAVLSVWPEETLNYDPRGPQGTWVSDLAKQTKTTIVTGFLAEQPVAWPNRAAPNMAAVFGPEGFVGVTYKVHPVLVAGEAWGGTTPQIFPTFSMPFGQLGVIVCFDHDFPNSSARLQVLTGSQIIANPAWDWGSISSVRWQSVVFRSIENRVPMVKGETGFDSVITDANGTVLQRTDVKQAPGEAGVLVADTHLSPRDAPFTQIGGLWFTVLVLLGFAARYIWQIRLWRRRDSRE